jgi:hypothetical protein
MKGVIYIGELKLTLEVLAWYMHEEKEYSGIY